MHDSWAYQLCLALDGRVYYDEKSYIKYRQHEHNVVGQESFISKLRRRYEIYFNGKSGTRLQNAKNLLHGYGNVITEQNKKLLTNLVNYKVSLKQKIKIILTPEFKTKNRESNIGFIISILFNKF
jgi:rhamnosyltransferase